MNYQPGIYTVSNTAVGAITQAPVMNRPDPDVEFIPSPDTDTPPPNGTSTTRLKINPLLLFLIIILLYTALSIWVQAGDKFIFQYLFRGREMTWWQLGLIAIAVTGFALGVTYLSGITLVELESDI